MGKFGKLRLPKFMTEPVGTDYGRNPSIDLPQDDPLKPYHETQDLKDVGLLPHGNRNAEPEVLNVYNNIPADLAEIHKAGYKERRLLTNELWAKIKTIDGTESIMQFTMEDDTSSANSEYMYCNLSSVYKDVEYKIPCIMYVPKNGDSYIEDYDLDNLEVEEYQPTDKRHSSNHLPSQNWKPARKQREIEVKDPENYYLKVFASITRLWEDGQNKPITFNAYREIFTISNPVKQLNSKTGEITTDEGEVIPFDDTSEFKVKGNNIYSATGIGFDAYREKYNQQMINNTSGKVTESFLDFMNEDNVNEDDVIFDQSPQEEKPESDEEPQDCNGCTDHPDTLSEQAKMAIKKICNEILIKEAQLCETSDDSNRTYESFLKECTHYMAECLIRAAQNLKL